MRLRGRKKRGAKEGGGGKEGNIIYISYLSGGVSRP